MSSYISTSRCNLTKDPKIARKLTEKSRRARLYLLKVSNAILPTHEQLRQRLSGICTARRDELRQLEAQRRRGFPITPTKKSLSMHGFLRPFKFSSASLPKGVQLLERELSKAHGLQPSMNPYGLLNRFDGFQVCDVWIETLDID
jgi:hypothetical protein